MFAQLESHDLGHHVHAGLGGGVEGVFGDGLHARLRRYVDDGAAALLRHHLSGGALRHHERRLQVGVESAVKLLIRCIGEIISLFCIYLF